MMERKSVRQPGATVTGFRPAVCSVTGLPATMTVRPSILRSRSGTSVAITSMTLSLSASEAEMLSAAAHRLLGPFDVALVQLGQAADIGGGVVDDLARLGVGGRRAGGLLAGLVRLLLAAAEQAAAAELYRRGRADIGAGRHGGNRAGIGDIGAGARRPRPARRNEGRDRHRRGQDGADDLAHGAVEPAGRVHAQDHEAGIGRAWRPQARARHSRRWPGRWRRRSRAPRRGAAPRRRPPRGPAARRARLQRPHASS